MFFGLTNSPATFQTMMNDIFCDLIAEDVRSISGSHALSWKAFAKTSSTLKPEKCEFEQTKVEYLGLIISHGTAEMDPVKVAGVAEWPELKNKTTCGDAPTSPSL
ncbi:hypothetical protein C0995_011729 [Termitomyces sp. Mi166|nr:hypothetical protein C0995_011729 [Termitomyces sp. Mi166\